MSSAELERELLGVPFRVTLRTRNVAWLDAKRRALVTGATTPPHESGWRFRVRSSCELTVTAGALCEGHCGNSSPGVCWPGCDRHEGGILWDRGAALAFSTSTDADGLAPLHSSGAVVERFTRRRLRGLHALAALEPVGARLERVGREPE